MPVYCYKCPSCEKRIEVSQGFEDPPPTCQCGENNGVEFERDYASEGGVGAQFKGSGFHATDYDTKEGTGR